MALEKASELLGKLNLSQENTRTSESKAFEAEEIKRWEAQRERSRIARKREENAIALGGYRALDTYTADRFIVNDHNEAAFKAAVGYDWVSQNVYFHGPAGTGKSHLATVAARKNVDKCALYKPFQISRMIRSSENALIEDDTIHRIASKRILVIDDLGTAKDTEFLVGLIYEIIDYRYMNLPGGMIITSNLSLDQLGSKMGDDRIPSRIAQMSSIFKLSGKDHRIQSGGK